MWMGRGVQEGESSPVGMSLDQHASQKKVEGEGDREAERSQSISKWRESSSGREGETSWD